MCGNAKKGGLSFHLDIGAGIGWALLGSETRNVLLFRRPDITGNNREDGVETTLSSSLCSLVVDAPHVVLGWWSTMLSCIF